MTSKWNFAKLNLLTLVTFILLGLFFARTIPLTRDTYFHLSIGRQVWQTKSIPTQDEFVYAPKDKDKHFTSTEWLSGLIFYTFVKLVGIDGLIILRIAIGLVTLYILFQTLKLITTNNLAILLGISTLGYSIAIRFLNRPEMFSFALVALVNYCCLYYYLKKKLPVIGYLLPVTFLAWPNIHGLAPLGLAILFFVLILESLDSLLSHKKSSNLILLFVVTLLSLIFSLVQYRRFFYFLAFRKVPIIISEMSSLGERLFWTRGFDFLNQISIEVYLFMVIFILYLFALFLFLRKKHREWTFGTLSIFYFCLLLLPFKYVRLAPVILLIVIPQFSFLIKQTFPKKTASFAPLAFKACLLIVLIFIFFSILTKQIVGAKYDYSIFSTNGQVTGVANRTWDSMFPYSTAKILKSNLVTRRLFTVDYWNDYFIWENYPIKTFGDAMYEPRTSEDFVDEQKLVWGKENWQSLLEKYDIDTVINTRTHSFFTNITPVWQLANWKLIYVDRTAAIYARGDVIRSIPVDLWAVNPNLGTPLKFKPEQEKVAVEQLQKLLEFNRENGFARIQLILYYLDKDLNRAKALAEESRNLLPDDPIFSIHLATIYVKLGQCPQARQFGREAIRKSFNHPVIKTEVERVLSGCR